MATILARKNIDEAVSTVDTYIALANDIFDDLRSTVESLIPANFDGDAAEGFKEFFNAKVVPALTVNLTEPSGSLTSSIKEMLESIKTQILDQVDPQLGEANRNPG